MDSDAKPARAASPQSPEERASENSTQNESSTQKLSTCSWCSKPVTECSGQCLYKPLPVPPASASRKIYHKHIHPRVQVKLPGIDFSAMMAVSPSPSSSPRAPTTSPQAYSPPPAAEVQIGDPGPTIIEAEDTTNLDQGATRRIRPGTRAADMASGPPLVPLNQVGPSAAIIHQVTPSGIKRLTIAQLESPFQLQEHIKALHYEHTRSTTDPTTTIPLTHETAVLIATPPANTDRSLYLYELTRFLTQHSNELLVALLTKIDPPCSAATCPEMRASEWQYLCAVHDTPKACCAVDYCIHTLDWAGDILSSVKLFPSRMTLGPQDSPGHQAAVRSITNIMRRVYRIFAHAWFQHREGVFWPVEASGGIYTLFKTVCDVYGLIQEDNYTIPPEAEGLTSKEEMEHDGQEKAGTKKTGGEEDAEDDTALQVSGATTRRHKHTPSVGSAVGTIAEGEEDESESPVKEKSGPLAQISNAAEKKENSTGKTENEPAVQEGSQAVGGASEEKQEDEEGAETGEGADDGNDAASIVTTIHVDEAEKEAEHEG